MFRPAGLVATALIVAAAPSFAHAWTKSYVVEWAELAMRYGGPESGAQDAAGADCPNGANPEMDWQTLLTTPYRPAEEVREIVSPDYRYEGQQAFYRHLAFRGPHKDNVYENPTAVDEGPLPQVASPIAEGFNLDGDAKTGFVGLDGERGVDNAFYKVSGCVLAFRGKARQAYGSERINEAMRAGRWTTVVVLSGEGAPLSDGEITVGVYHSTDRLVKDAGGGIAADYTFRIDPNPEFQSVFKASLKGGVVETNDPILFRTHDVSLGERKVRLDLYRAKVRWEIKSDGSMSGLVGGYREWFEHYRDIASGYRDLGDAARAGPRENLGRYSLPSWYQAMRKAADGLPDPKTGKNLGISTVYRFNMLPAFAVTPDAGEPVKVATTFEEMAAK